MLGVELLGNRGLPVHSDEDESENERETEAIEKSNQVCKQRAKMVSRKNGFEGEERKEMTVSRTLLYLSLRHIISLFLIQHGVKAKQ
jgi:hypothetical protein